MTRNFTSVFTITDSTQSKQNQSFHKTEACATGMFCWLVFSKEFHCSKQLTLPKDAIILLHFLSEQ